VGCQIVVTGHSLGGAMAQLAALDIVERYTKVTVITYGSPRVGDVHFSMLFMSTLNNTIRMVHEKDIIPKIPSYTFLGYYHTVQEVWDHNNAFQLCDSENGEDDNCSRSVGILSGSLVDHYNYFGLNQQAGHTHGCHTGNNTITELDFSSKLKLVMDL